jgi:hypothetical protein
MSVAAKATFAVLGAIFGAVAGGIAGLLAGLGYTELAGTSSFEGYSGYVAGLWMLIGIILGLIAGIVWGLRYAGSLRPADGPDRQD